MINPGAAISITAPHDAAELTSPEPPVLEYAPVAPPSLRSRTVRTSLWTLLGFGASQIVRFGSNLVLTRLLVPHDFGLAALVGILLRG